MFYISATLAIAGAVGYQYFIKRIPASLNPFISVIGIYAAILVIGISVLPFLSYDGGILEQIRQLSWVQFAVAVSILLLDVGFLLMYRYGWKLSTGSLITGVFTNIILLILGVGLLGESVTVANIMGIIMCIIGVVLVNYRP